MSAYYNEIDPFAAEWLRNLIAAGHIAPGDVDERSVEDVQPDDLAGYVQCHFFAGIGVWSHALRTAGWADDAPVWTGSCPCQPFSAAGKRSGFADARHLWPAWSRLIAERRPRVVFGEQVASNDGYAWLDAVQADLEAMGYACGPVVLPAAGFGAPHGRHRIYFVADARPQPAGRGLRGPSEGSGPDGVWAPGQPERSGDAGLVADAGRERGAGRRDVRDMERAPVGDEGEGGQRQRLWDPADHRGADGGLADDEAGRWREVDPLAAGRDERTGPQGNQRPVRGDGPDFMGHSNDQGLQGRIERGDGADERPAGSASLAGFWRDAEWVWCRDERYRPIEPGTFPLAHGAPARVGRLRAYGNAIVAPVAAEFVRAYIESAA